MALSKDDIGKIRDLASLTVNVPEWNGDVIIKQWDVADRLQVDDWLESKDKEFGLKVVAMSLVDEKGNLLFTPDELRPRNAKVIIRLLRSVLDHNGMSSQSVEDAQKK